MKLHNVLIRPTDLFEEILRRKLISGGGGSVLQTVTGISPLTIIKIASRGIKSLIQFGKCEQGSTPTPSVPVDIMCNNGALKMVDDELPTGYKRVLGFKMNNNSYWEIADFPLYGSDTLRFSFDANDGCNVLGAYSGSASGNNYSLYVSTNSNYLRYKSGAYNSAIDYDKRYDVELAPTGSSGMKVDSTWTAQTFTTPTNLCIGTTAKSASSAKLKGNLYGNIEIVGRAKFVPCERVSDNALGYYDTIGKAFYEQASGFSGAVSLGYDGSHYSLAVNGTPEVLTICGKNIYNKNYTASEINAFINSTNNTLTQGTTQYAYVLPCKPNTTYTASGMGERTSRWGSFTSKALGTVATAYASGNGTITTGANDKYIIGLISAQSQSGDIDFHDTLQIEVGSTATDYEAYSEQTASATDLFAIGDYKDEQNIVSGEVTKACGIKVLDGTEDWSSDGATLQVAVADCVKGTIRKVPMLCTHYPIVSNGASWNDTPTNSMYGTPGGKIGVKNTMSTDNYKSFLSTQYANGTPVVIVYPLAEPTTEQVTAQHLTARDTATITAQTNNISGVTLEVQYWQKAE